MLVLTIEQREIIEEALKEEMSKYLIDHPDTPDKDLFTEVSKSFNITTVPSISTLAEHAYKCTSPYQWLERPLYQNANVNLAQIKEKVIEYLKDNEYIKNQLERNDTNARLALRSYISNKLEIKPIALIRPLQCVLEELRTAQIYKLAPAVHNLLAEGSKNHRYANLAIIDVRHPWCITGCVIHLYNDYEYRPETLDLIPTLHDNYASQRKCSTVRIPNSVLWNLPRHTDSYIKGVVNALCRPAYYYDDCTVTIGNEGIELITSTPLPHIKLTDYRYYYITKDKYNPTIVISNSEYDVVFRPLITKEGGKYNI